MATTTFPTKEFNTDGTKKTGHLFANGSDVGTIETATSTPAIFWNHGDHLRSTSLVTDVSGAISEDVRYAPFGKIVENTGAHREQRKFTSHEYDSHAPTNYSYAEARYLDTMRGRFISEDSEYLAVGDKDFKQNYNRILENFLSDPQLANSYSYASNNPLRFYDPDGRQVALAPSFGQVAAGILALGAAIASAPAWVPAAIVIGTIGVIGATTYQLLQDKPNEKPDTTQTGTNTAPATPQPAPKPEDIKGKGNQEIGEVLKEKGWEYKGPSRGGGEKWVKPGSPGEQVRLEPGNPKNSNPVKRGPYGRISTGGPKGGETSPPIPLKGNPTLEPKQ